MSRSRRPATRSARLASSRSFTTLELLENRRLMCQFHQDAGLPESFQIPTHIETEPAIAGGEAAPANIVWNNRGTPTSDTDRFNSVFGANSEKARKVVDAVIVAYERMIGSFNYSDGSANYNLSLSMASSGSSLGASASLNSTLGPVGSQKPKSGTITMGRGGGGTGGGWFLDQTPEESSEFLGNIVNAYSGDATGGGPAVGQSDFYTVVAAEMTHCMGLYGGTGAVPSWDALITNTGINDTAEGGGVGKFWVFRGPSIKHLLTGNNGGPGGNIFNGGVHAAGPNVPVTFPVGGADVYLGAQDQGNAIYEQGRRYMINNTFALMFKDAYGYSTVNPDKWGTMYSMLDSTTGRLTIRGGSGNSNDNISVSKSGSVITVSVDAGTDVAGTGALPGAGNLPAFVSEFDASQVTFVSLNAGGGNDTITLNNIPAGAIGDIIGGSGNDTITIGGGNLLQNIAGTLSVEGSGGTDALIYDDVLSTGADSYTLNGMTLSKPGLPTLNILTFTSITLNANDFDNTILVNSTAATTTINAGAGNDTLTLGNGSLGGIVSPISVNGQGDADTVILDDSAELAGASYQINGTLVTRSGFGALTIGTVEAMRLNAQQGNDQITVQNTAAGISLTLQPNGGHDTITINETAAGSPVAIEASAGDDDVLVNADGIGSAAAQFVSAVTELGALTIGDGGSATVLAGDGRVLRISSLSINGAGFLDLNDGALIYDYTGPSPLATVKSLLSAGYAAAAWNGAGIRSTTAENDLTQQTALGYAEASDVFTTYPATFADQQIDDDSTIMVRYTYYGDANLDGQVNLNDFTRLAGNFNATGQDWSHGDFNYDGTVNVADFTLLAGTFGGTGLAPDQADALLRSLRLPGGSTIAVNPLPPPAPKSGGRRLA